MYFLRNCTLHLATIMVLLLVLILILVTQKPNFASKWFVIYCALTTSLVCSSNSFYVVDGPSYFFFLPVCIVYISNVIINMYIMLCLYFMFSWRIEFIRHITIVSCLALCFRFATGKTIKIFLKTYIRITWIIGLDIRSTHVKFSCII